jgi:hypothetical protein
MREFEKLGVFYLGRAYRQGSGEASEELLLYDSRDLTTHAVCVGMTGSGKTGLCVSLLEEAAMDGIPAIAVDPKGDLSNLMLTFPGLSGKEFLPWVDPEEASRRNMSPEAFAEETARVWKNGLAQWGQDGGRIGELRNRAQFRLYTPGGSAGIPLSVIRSLDAPPAETAGNPEALADRVETAVSGLLTLAGERDIDIHGREHVLLSSILAHVWGRGGNTSPADLVRAVQNPPMSRLGVLDVETFFPAQERLKLAMRLNSLVASPGFARWTRGEPLNIGSLLYSPEGKPRVSILSISHLSDEERMFFVSLLLEEVVAWMRTLPGTGSLRAVLYMDEIFGFFPPGEAPPSKKPMLTLLKQARAYGLGVVLATQNPVDLDYRGLSNTGTWFVGRLQTERDKQRLMDGLESASASFMDRPEMDRILSGLDKRVFLLHDVHRGEPELFQTRWAMSYLRGPLTPAQLRSLNQEGDYAAFAETSPATPAPAAAAGVSAAEPVQSRPAIPSDVEEFFVPLSPGIPRDGGILYKPSLLVSAKLHFVSARDRLDLWEDCALSVPVTGGEALDWNGAVCCRGVPPALEGSPAEGARYGEVSLKLLGPSAMKYLKSRAATSLYQEQTVTLWTGGSPRLSSEPGEDRAAFLERLVHSDREDRDAMVDKLRETYQKRLTALQDRVRRAQQRLDREKEQYSHQKTQTAVSVGATIMGALLGRGIGAGSVGRATTAVRGAARASREKQDITSAENELQVQQERLRELEEEFRKELDGMEEPVRPEDMSLEERIVRPRKSDVHIAAAGLLWIPWHAGSGGFLEPAGRWCQAPQTSQ